MATQLSLSSARSFRSFGITARSRLFDTCLPIAPDRWSDRLSAEFLPVPNPTGVFCVSRTSALRNPTRHEVTTMAPQDFPLCAAFQEE